MGEVSAVTVSGGWSQDIGEVERTRLFAALIEGAEPSGQTAYAPRAVADELGIAVDVSLALQEWCSAGLIDCDDSLVPGSAPIILTQHGREAAAEFTAARGHRRQEKAARRAMLLWLYDRDEAVSTQDMHDDPAGWWYGRQFSLELVTAVARRLFDEGWIEGAKTGQDGIARASLTPKGVTCVERYGGDSQEMEAAMAMGGGVTIGQYHQSGGNAAFGSVGVEQTASHSEPGFGLADLASVLDLLKAQSEVPERLDRELAGIRAQLNDAKTSDEAADAARVAKGFLEKLKPLVNPLWAGVVSLGAAWIEAKLGGS